MLEKVYHISLQISMKLKGPTTRLWVVGPVPSRKLLQAFHYPNYNIDSLNVKYHSFVNRTVSPFSIGEIEGNSR